MVESIPAMQVSAYDPANKSRFLSGVSSASHDRIFGKENL